MTDGSTLSPPPLLSLSYPAVPASVPTARHVVVDFAERAGADGGHLQAIRLAVSEAVTNVVRHAYDTDAGAIHITVAKTGEELWVLIGDDGHGLQSHSADPGLGLGLALIASVSDYYAVVKRAAGGTEMRMRFHLSGEEERWTPLWRSAQPAGSLAFGSAV